jgi:16S rRNA (cytidine1402-2'-O)-methyltransferase
MKVIENINIRKIDLQRPAVYVVATPIGNMEDITIRALKILFSVDMVICEEYKTGSKLLHTYEIKQELLELNEHNEQKYSSELALKIVSESLAVALISDAGTPLFADPGNSFIPVCYESGIRIIPVPGTSSIMAALMAAGINSNGFLYYGFLPANKNDRQQAIRKLPSTCDLVIMEAPYRLQQLLADLEKFLGSRRQAALCWQLTCPDEQIFLEDLGYLKAAAQGLGKGEFVLILRQKDQK